MSLLLRLSLFREKNGKCLVRLIGKTVLTPLQAQNKVAPEEN